VEVPGSLESVHAVDVVQVVALDGGFPVLAGVDFAAPRGSITAVLGSNGAGKTSLLRTLAGLTSVASGTGHVLGVSVAEPERKLIGRVGLLGHDTGCYEDLSPAANLRFLSRILRADPKRADAVLARVGLTGRLGTTAMAELSAGQRRRAALAQLVLRAPELWLLDEPHASLDGVGRDLVDAVMVDAASSGMTVVFTSHDPAGAAHIADHVCTMAGGVLVDRSDGEGRGVDVP
jgi:heme ABC exporter ATP-binding subunit CcmA